MIEIYKRDFLAGPRKVLATVHRDGPVLITDNGRPVVAIVKPEDVAADRRIIEAARKALDLLDIALGDSDLFDADDESPLAQAFQELGRAIEAADKENE